MSAKGRPTSLSMRAKTFAAGGVKRRMRPSRSRRRRGMPALARTLVRSSLRRDVSAARAESSSFAARSSSFAVERSSLVACSSSFACKRSSRLAAASRFSARSCASWLKRPRGDTGSGRTSESGPRAKSPSAASTIVSPAIGPASSTGPSTAKPPGRRARCRPGRTRRCTAGGSARAITRSSFGKTGSLVTSCRAKTHLSRMLWRTS